MKRCGSSEARRRADRDLMTRRFGRLFRIGGLHRDIDEEIEYHFQRTVEALIAEGLDRAAAVREAERRFGDRHRYESELERIDRTLAASRRLADWTLARRDDLRHTLRGLRRAPAFTAGVVLTFALGIGANATMFGILDRLLLRPPEHIANPDGVRRLLVDRFVPFTGARHTTPSLTYPDLQDLRRARTFDVAAYDHRRLVVGEGQGAREIAADLVSGTYFDLLGVRPALGRLLGPGDDREGAVPVAVLGYAYWQRAYGGDPSVIGRTLDFGHGPYEIVGVTPRGFTGVDLSRVDIWLPFVPAGVALQGRDWEESRGWWWFAAIARLRPGVSSAAAEAEATTLHRAGRADQIERGDYDAGVRILAAPLIAARGPLASGESRVAKWLAGVALVVLLIACVNVANLLLARTIRRQRETGVRLALGISRGRLLGGILLDSLVLAVLGGGVALLVARWGGGLLRHLLLPNIVWPEAIGGRVALFVLGATLLAGLLAGLLPAWQTRRAAVLSWLKGGGRGTTSASRTRAALSAAQATLSVVLLVGAGLFVRSLRNVESVDLGFDPRGVLAVIPVMHRDLTGDEQRAFMARTAERLRRLPGVAHASESLSLPFYTSFAYNLWVPGLDSIPTPPTGGPYVNVVGPDFFATMGLRILRGRALGPDDVASAPRVAVVNESMARRLWPGQDALGKCLTIDRRDAPCTTVVGIVEDSHRQEIAEEETLLYYVPAAQQIVKDAPPQVLVARARGTTEGLAPAIRRDLLAAESGLLRYVRIRPLEEMIDPQMRSWRLGAAMFSVFGALALAVAAIGLYSMLAFSVAQRKRELGIRSALGATRQRLLRRVVGDGLRLAGLGIALGLAIALAAAPLLQPLLFHVSARDPLTLAGVAVVLLLVAAAASGLPAWRAAGVDPNEALRAE